MFRCFLGLQFKPRKWVDGLCLGVIKNIHNGKLKEVVKLAS